MGVLDRVCHKLRILRYFNFILSELLKLPVCPFWPLSAWGEGKSYLRSWQKVRQLPGLHLKKDLFSAYPNPPSSVGNVSTPVPCLHRIAVQDILYPEMAFNQHFFLSVLCFASSASGGQPCIDGNRNGRKSIIGRTPLVFLFASKHCWLFQDCPSTSPS